MPPESSGTVEVIPDADASTLPADLDLSTIESLVRVVIDEEGAVLRSVHVVLSDHDRVRALNRDYLGHDYHTDVLAFSFAEAPGEADGETFPTGGSPAVHDGDNGSTGPPVEGEVYVDLETAAERHGEFGATVEEEVRRYVIHGVLHLLGYDDGSDAGNAEMRDLENHYLDRDGAGGPERSGS